MGLHWCGTHLKRGIQKLSDSNVPKVKRLAHDLLHQQRLLFQQWRSYKKSEVAQPALSKRFRNGRRLSLLRFFGQALLF